MTAMKNLLHPLALLLALAAGTAQALTRHAIEAGSPNGEYYFREGPRTEPLAQRWVGPRFDGLQLDVEARSNPGGLYARYQQSGWDEWTVGGGSGWAGARSNATVYLEADAPGGPAFIDVLLNLRLTGGATLSATLGAQASGGFEVRVLATGNRAGLIETAATGLGAPAPTSVSQNLWRSGPDHLVAALHLPVDQAVPVNLVLFANGGGGGAGMSTVDSAFGLGFFEGAEVFELPAGYRARSADWSIEDNHWCPGGCAAVPEPSSWPLLLTGLGLLVWKARRAPRAGADTAGQDGQCGRRSWAWGGCSRGGGFG